MSRKSRSSASHRVAESTESAVSRRAFLAGGTALAGAAALQPAMGQTPATTPSSAVNLSTGQITQITMVVHDAQKTAKNFSHVFGPSWRFYDYQPSNVIVHDQPVSEPIALKMAVGYCGGFMFKLVQPVSGPSTYADFLDKNGSEGFYSIGVGVLRGYDQAVAALKQAGVSVDWQADDGTGTKVTVFNTAADLGPRVEMASGPKTTTSAQLKETGRFAPTAAPIIDMGLPVSSGGRRFTQIGLVVKDAHASSAKWEALLGVTNWHFIPIPVSAASLRGHVYTDAELPSATVEQGVAYLGSSQIELLAPVAQDPGGIHRKFYDKHGSFNGFQHLMISPAGGDHDEVLARCAKEGIDREWTATVHIGKMTGSGDYIDFEKLLGGFVLEFNG